MKDYLSELSESIPVRRTPEQHDEIFDYVKSEAEAVGLECKVELLGGKHKNIVIGDVENANAVITAHYDTPARSLVPNLMMPRNHALCLLYGFGIPIAVALVSLGISNLVGEILNVPPIATPIIYLILYFGMFFGMMRCGSNKNNKNDNTSGVATVLSVMAKRPEGAAYILFDNEEKGLLGSKAYNKAHKELMKNKLIINLDCVGNGDNIIVVSKPQAEAHPVCQALKDTMTDGDGYKVHYFPQKGSCANNTDYKSFPCSMSVMACKQKGKIFYTSKIHTSADTEAKTENTVFIADRIAKAMGGNI